MNFQMIGADRCLTRTDKHECGEVNDMLKYGAYPHIEKDS